MTPTDPTKAALEARPVSSLSKREKAWLKRRECGWCAAKCTATRCQAMYGDPCDVDAQRAVWLQSYKPRATELDSRGREG